LLQFGIIFCSTTTNLHKVLIMQKRIIRVMLGLRHRSSCRQKFKKLQILTVPSLYILEMMTFLIKHHNNYQTNDSNHSKDIRPKKKIHLQSIRLSSGQKGVCSSSIRILINFHHTLYNCMKIQWTLRTL
jgi:predicted nucleic acid-binding protein